MNETTSQSKTDQLTVDRTRPALNWGRHSKPLLSGLAATLLAITLLLTTSATGQAESPDSPTEQGPLDVVLLLDSSGSMLVTDPQNLRIEGAKLFNSLLSKNDRVAVLSFDDEPKLLLPFTEKARGLEINRIIESSVAQGRYSDLKSAIEKAFNLLTTQARPEASKMIVLLSDGKLEPHPSHGSTKESTDKLINKIAPDLKSGAIKIYSLAFSDLADQNLLSKLSSGTGGLNWYTPNAEKIHRSFAELLLVSKRPQVIPNREMSYFIDELVNEATFYVSREKQVPVSLIDPDGHALTKLSSHLPNLLWYNSRQFDVVTVSEPMAGEWKIVGGDPKSGYVTALTELKLVAKWPNIIYSGEPILLEAQLYEGNKPLRLSGINSLTNYGFQVIPADAIAEPVLEASLEDQGERGDKRAGDGIFSAKVKIKQPGRYRLKVRARAPTFEREQDVPFEVREGILNVKVVDCNEVNKKKGHDDHSNHHDEHHEEHDHHADSAGHSSHSGHNCFQVTVDAQKDVRLRDPKIELTAELLHLKEDQASLEHHNLKQVKVELKLKNAKKSPLTLYASEDQLTLPGEYQLQAKLIAYTRSGKLKTMSEPVTFEKHESAHSDGHHEVESEEEPEESAPQQSNIMIFIALITVINGGVGAWLFKQSKSLVIRCKESPETPKAPNLEAYFNEVEAVAAEESVDLNDSRYLQISNETEEALPEEEERKEEREESRIDEEPSSSEIEETEEPEEPEEPSEESEAEPDE